MEHNMTLRPAPFAMIRSGQKVYELRLWDEKRRLLAPGDTILFTNSDAPDDTLRARIDSLHVFADFSALYDALPLLQCGYTETDVSSAHPGDMDAYYPPERQAQYGVVGIKLTVL